MNLSERLAKLTQDLTCIIKDLSEEKSFDTKTFEEMTPMEKNDFQSLSDHAKYVIPLSAKINSILRQRTNKTVTQDEKKSSKQPSLKNSVSSLTSSHSSSTTQTTSIGPKQTISTGPKQTMSSGPKQSQDKYLGCYSCKTGLWRDDMRHKVYTNMCWLCGNINFAKRDFKKDLTGKIAIVTGGRVKIGYETAVRLLRNGCTVIVTSRFVDDCLERYEKDQEFGKFKDRLFIYQLNMLNGANIKQFVKYVFDNFSKVDFLINNAAQTIKRPKAFFEHLIDKIDTTESKENSKMIVHRDATELKLLDVGEKLLIGYTKDEVSELFPKGKLDLFGQQIDLRTENSWMLEAENVDLVELAEVYIINSIGPYMLSTQLKPLMTRTKTDYSWIINVTSMEGVFNWDKKPSRHPHTNMAKAALNMFTRTSGQQYIKSNIIMVCVDTGWNNAQQPNSYDFETPIDCADGASRILDPIYRELKKHSILYKNYEVNPW